MAENNCTIHWRITETPDGEELDEPDEWTEEYTVDELVVRDSGWIALGGEDYGFYNPEIIDTIEITPSQ